MNGFEFTITLAIIIAGTMVAVLAVSGLVEMLKAAQQFRQEIRRSDHRDGN